ncbi:MAG: beta-phosphoglucomutase [Anaerocolumna sp.]
MAYNQKRVDLAYPYSEWEIVEDKYLPEHNLRNETLFTIGNGHIGIRGNFEEGCHGDKEETIEGTYINGFYESEIIKYGEIAYGYAEKSQTMLNVANCKLIRLFIEDEEFCMSSGSIAEYKRTLSLKEGILTRSLVWCSPKGRKVRIIIKRLASFKNKFLAAIRYEVTPINFNGKIKLISALDGNVTNLTVENDPRIGSGLQGRVLNISEKVSKGNSNSIVQKTKNSKLVVACSVQNKLDTVCGFCESNIIDDFLVGNEFSVDTCTGQNVILNKYIVYVTSRDCEESRLSIEAGRIATKASEMGFDSIIEEQALFLRDFWMRTDVEIKGDPSIQQGIRVNIFHLLQSVGRDGITNIGAKGLTGEGYEGHYFWDTETFILPFFLYNNPDISRKLLEYRYGILDKARERARQMSHTKGALFPWRTINGEECSAYYPAGTAQYHINADISFAIKKYMDATGDNEFMIEYGAELLFETARFWATLGFFNPRKENKFCINGVTGPDEYNAIVNNNCYTNLMAKENLEYAYEMSVWFNKKAPEKYKELAQKINLSKQEPEYWKKAADNMLVPYDEITGIYLQDDGFLDRVPWDFDNTPKEKYPLLLHYHPLVIYRHQVCKQADLVLALFMLGDKFSQEEKRKNFNFYEKVTTHDSSLSTAIFSVVASEIGYQKKALEYFECTARMDLDDYHGNTKDGIHAANMAGTWMCVVNGFAGMRVFGGMLSFNPYLPEGWEEYSFKVTYQRRLIMVTVNSDGTFYEMLEGKNITIKHKGENRLLRCSEIKAVIFDLDGVIVSTDDKHFEAWNEIAKEEGIYFDKKINNRLRGVGRAESLEILLELSKIKYTFEQKQELAQKKNEYYKTLIQRLTPQDILPGVQKLIESLRAAGIKIAIGSSSKNANAILKSIGLHDSFDVIVSGHNIAKSKPDPEIYLLAAEHLGIAPEACIVVEDAQVGVDAAIAAGMKSVGIGDASLHAKVSIRRDSLDKLTIEDLISL